MSQVVNLDMGVANEAVLQQQQQKAENLTDLEERDTDIDLAHADHQDNPEDLALKRFKTPAKRMNPKRETGDEGEKQPKSLISTLSTPESFVRHKRLSKELQDGDATLVGSSTSSASGSVQSEIDYDAIRRMDLSQFKDKHINLPSLAHDLERKNVNDIAFPDGHHTFAQNSSTTAWEVPTSKPEFRELYQKCFPAACISNIVESFKHHTYSEDEMIRIAEYVAIVFVTNFLIHERLTGSLGMTDIQIYTMRHEEDNVPYPFAEVCSHILRYKKKEQRDDNTSVDGSVTSMKDLVVQTLLSLETVRRVNVFLETELNLKTAAEGGAHYYKSLTHETVNTKFNPQWVEWLVSAAAGLVAACVMLYLYK